MNEIVDVWGSKRFLFCALCVSVCSAMNAVVSHRRCALCDEVRGRDVVLHRPSALSFFVCAQEILVVFKVVFVEWNLPWTGLSIYETRPSLVTLGLLMLRMTRLWSSIAQQKSPVAVRF